MSPISGVPAAFGTIALQENSDINEGFGGIVSPYVAASTLKYGDLVFRLPGGRVDKSLEASLYPALFCGVVVGGATTQYQATEDAGLIGDNMSVAGQQVLVLTRGVAYVGADVTDQVRLGDPIVAGQTTAGRALGGETSSYTNTTAGTAFNATTTAKSTNAFTPICVGIPGTATAANLTAAALSGTVNNGTWNVFALRVATNGTSVTSAMGTAATTLAGVLWPTAGAANLVTYGYIIIHPTGAGNFVGGTTALNDGAVIPNAQYFNLVSMWKRLGVAVSVPATGAGSAFLMSVRG